MGSAIGRGMWAGQVGRQVSRRGRWAGQVGRQVGGVRGQTSGQACWWDVAGIVSLGMLIASKNHEGYNAIQHTITQHKYSGNSAFETRFEFCEIVVTYRITRNLIHK